MARVKDEIKSFYKITLAEDSENWLIDDRYILDYIEKIIDDTNFNTAEKKIKEIKGLISAYNELHNH